MDATSITSLITGQIASFGLAALAVLASLVVVMVGLLVFRFGWYKLLHDQSLEIGGYYVRKTPYRGYNRFRSKAWNMAHMP